jgi:hypothetical protein
MGHRPYNQHVMAGKKKTTSSAKAKSVGRKRGRDGKQLSVMQDKQKGEDPQEQIRAHILEQLQHINAEAQAMLKEGDEMINSLNKYNAAVFGITAPQQE